MFSQELIPTLLWQFALTVAFSFVIGLEFHSYRRAAGRDLGFGTTRTFTLIGLFGFTLYILDPQGHLYLLGMVLLAAFLLIYYARRVTQPRFSLLSPLLALMTYLIGPIVLRMPDWFLVLFAVTVLIMLGEKPGIRRLSDAMREEEMVVLARFLIMAGVILPLLPDRQIAPFVTVTYYQAWLAMVVVSGLSYASYLAQTYFFKQRGMLLTGLLGGLYSSTAATVVIARQATQSGDTRSVSPAIVLATAMMYLRLLLLIVVLGHHDAAMRLAAPFLLFVLASCATAFMLYRNSPAASATVTAAPLTHPLEVSTAATFAMLFVIFAALTQFIVGHFGSIGLHTLSFVTGLTDIDPFILSLLAGKLTVDPALIIGAIVIASGSNNLFKAGYALALARRHGVGGAVLWLAGLFIASLIYVFWIL